MEKTAFQGWADGRILRGILLEDMELAWFAALAEAKESIVKEHGNDSPVVKNILKIIDNLAK